MEPNNAPTVSLAALPQLEEFVVVNLQVTSLKAISGCLMLTELVLRSFAGNADMSQLSSLTNLEELTAQC